MNKSFLTLTLTLFLPFTLANYDFPAVNFTMNFLGNIGMERITGDYAMCHANVNESLYSALYLPSNYETRGVDAFLNTAAILLSNLYDINSTCQSSGREIAHAFHLYIMKFKNGNYPEALLQNLFDTSHTWINYTTRFKSCYYYHWWGCAGAMAGKFSNVVFNVTPKVEYEEVPELHSKHEWEPGSVVGTLRMVFDMVTNFLNKSELLAMDKMSGACRTQSDGFSVEFSKALDMISENHPEAARQLLWSFRPLKVIYASCDGIIQELSLIHISEPTRLLSISYAVFCLKKKKKKKKNKKKKIQKKTQKK
eukprot:TRINITY_DN2362_c0_g1_i3.p2 TRINITY_DN2362_c0_g1~~TRINITY_DN2362_c0_g1_i3.p2  ORF type:complete len:309 (-),score=82.20 TRINITY_DN2362_c0_g1_i3:10-936(-)